MEKIVKDIDYNLKFIIAYVNFNRQLIASEYFKLFGHFIGNRFDRKNNEYFNQLQEIYGEFIKQDDIIIQNIIEIEQIKDIDLKISMHKKILNITIRLERLLKGFLH